MVGAPTRVESYQVRRFESTLTLGTGLGLNQCGRALRCDFLFPK